MSDTSTPTSFSHMFSLNHTFNTVSSSLDTFGIYFVVALKGAGKVLHNFSVSVMTEKTV